ncbi:MAG: uncharacterized protein KVP18_004356 [Porospora cf. gigantea A]|uniref:uncharacterized protein n=1 Tax=Porospora cf. gigantea A TaxID=2853593 RepID=UPI00355AC147|nr:MAG: hypothetical protein KVP18_004356 [Porospora cf. gigantea A]
MDRLVGRPRTKGDPAKKSVHQPAERERPAPVFEGKLLKWTNYYGTWKERLFTLEAGVLKYWDGDKVKETFSIKDAQFVPMKFDDSRFDIAFLDGRVIYLKTLEDSSIAASRFEWKQKFAKAQQVFAMLESSVRYEARDVVDTEEEVLSLERLLEHCQVTKEKGLRNLKDIGALQSKMIQVAASCNDQRFRDAIKQLCIEIVQKIEGEVTLSNRSVRITETIVIEELVQRRKLEASLRQLAKEHYTLRQQMNTFTETVRVDSGMHELDDVKEKVQRVMISLQREETHARHEPESMSEEDFFDALSDESSEPEVAEKEKPEELGTPVISVSRRVRLPKPRTEMKVSLWSILKDCIGRDLSRVALPVYFNEPTSFLQRLSEDFQYADLLDKAAAQSNSLQRLVHVVAFSISPYESAAGRTFKPFNPLLGETYEMTHRGFKFIAEQVGHHPPKTAYHAHNENFEVEGDLVVNNSFSGKSIQVNMPGTYHIRLPKTKDHFTLSRMKLSINNVIFGKLTLEIYGSVIVTNQTTGEFAYVEYMRRGWWDYNEPNEVKALIYNAKAQPCFLVYGNWTRELHCETIIAADIAGVSAPLTAPAERRDLAGWVVDWATVKSDPASRVLLWKCLPRPPWSSHYYSFGYMTMQLNELSFEYSPEPDQRLLEDGEPLESNEEKRRLEDRQREAARSRPRGESDHRPRWFCKTRDDFFGGEAFKFTHEYWDAKASGSIEGCMDIF